MPFFNLPEYQQSIGARWLAVATYQGPAAYVAGGDTLSANTLGWGSFDRVSGSISFNANNSGNYTAQILYPVSQAPAVSNNSVVQSTVPTGSPTVKVKWVAANGTEAANNTNLSSEFARIEMIGG